MYVFDMNEGLTVWLEHTDRIRHRRAGPAYQYYINGTRRENIIYKMHL